MKKLYKAFRLRKNMKKQNFEMKNLGCFNKNTSNLDNERKKSGHEEVLILVY